MCRSQKTPVNLVSSDLFTIQQLLDELWRRIRDPSVQPRNLRQLQVAFNQEWAWIPKNVVRRHMFLVVGWLVLLLYVPSQQLWSLRDGQFT